MKLTNMHTTHPVIACPVCEVQIEAKVEIEPTFGQPNIRAGTREVAIPVTGKMIRFNVEHACPGPALPDAVTEDRT